MIRENKNSLQVKSTFLWLKIINKHIYSLPVCLKKSNHDIQNKTNYMFIFQKGYLTGNGRINLMKKPFPFLKYILRFK